MHHTELTAKIIGNGDVLLTVYMLGLKRKATLQPSKQYLKRRRRGTGDRQRRTRKQEDTGEEDTEAPCSTP
jgi:hypothetical protein